MKKQSGIRKKGRQGQGGNVLILCVIAIAVLLTMTNVITSQVISRSYFTKRVADFNDYVLYLEDANIQYRKEFSVLEAETVELVTYYFQYQFYSRNQPAGFNGPIAHHNKYLKNCISPQFQKMIKEYYKQEYDSYKDGAGKVDEENLTGTIEELANFLYVYIMSYRMSTATPMPKGEYRLEKKMKDLTGRLKTNLSPKGEFGMGSTITVDRKLITHNGSTNDIDGDTITDYLGYDATKPFATAKINTTLTVDSGFGFELSKVKQEVVFELSPEAFGAEYNGATFTLSRNSIEDKLAVRTWSKEGEK